MKNIGTFEIKFNNQNQTKSFNMTSIEESIQLARLQQAANSSSLYERKHNQKALKVLTVAAYILFVSMAAIILSFYYVFIWDPTSKQIPPHTTTNCDPMKKIVIPENIAIQLANSSEVSAEYFFRNLYERYQQLQKQEQTQNRNRTNNVNTILPLKSLFKPLIKPQVDNILLDNQRALPVSTVGTTKQISQLPRNIATANNPAFVVQDKDQEAYTDDEDLETDYDQSEASGANRMHGNDTSIIFQFEN